VELEVQVRGRKPRPTVLKELTGNPGKRALNAKEPNPVGDLADAPTWLSQTQREGWEYAIAHAPPRLLRKIDRAVLTVWVVAEDLHREATLKLMRLNPSFLVKTPGDQFIQSPYLAIINRQAGIMLKAAEQLGFSPAARPRLQVPPASPSPNGRAASAEGIGFPEAEDFQAFLAEDPEAPTTH
jgi:P27 family predicted phage terminase small subunit